ncbi:MAG: hypothetical protein QM769_14590 [Pseudoxanthomonas sp.]
MDETTFRLLTSFIVKVRKISGPIDSDKLLHDADYARETFRQVDEQGDEELVLLSLRLREQLHANADGKGGEQAKTAETKSTKSYLFGARS